jgi:hypothetical protein
MDNSAFPHGLDRAHRAEDKKAFEKISVAFVV